MVQQLIIARIIIIKMIMTLIPVEVCSQKSIEIINNSTELEGDSIFYGYFENGALEETGCYRIGYNIGVEMDSSILEMLEFIDINYDSMYVRTGLWREYYPNGNVRWEGSYYPGYIVKFHEELDSINNSIKIIEKVQYARDGIWLHYCKNGKLKEKLYYKKGKLVKISKVSVE